MGKSIRTSEVDDLFEMIEHLSGKEEFYAFFEDLCTVNEVLSLAQRMDVARRLNEGQTYQEVTAATGASTATISRVNRILNYGTGGLKAAIDSTEKKED